MRRRSSFAPAPTAGVVRSPVRSVAPAPAFVFILLLTTGLLLALAPQAHAHAANESYLVFTVDGTNLTGRLDIARRDLQQGIRLAGAGAGPALEALAPDELLRREEAYALDLVSQLQVLADGRRLTLEATDFTTLPLNSGEYARTLFTVAPAPARRPDVLQVNCRSLFGIDRSMHGLLRVEHDGRTEAIAYTIETPEHSFALDASIARWRQWTTFVAEGVWHIWIGFDHILFLIALLLPAVFRQGPEGWAVVERFRPAFINVLKIVTAFTVAHSITLSLAALGLVELPSRLVESAIAASVVLAAANNLRPWFKDKGWIIAFAFGLIHGFGFANVLGELGLQRGSLAVALVGFNIGVELGQLAIVGVFLPIAFALRQTWLYRVLTLKAGSAVVILIATAWMIERLFDVDIPGI